MRKQPAGLDGSRLKAFRILKGLGSQQIFAATVGVSQSHLSDLEQGRLRNQTAFLKVADLLDCTTDFLFRRGPYKKADGTSKLREAACRMAFDVFAERIGTADAGRRERWLGRCSRVIGHKAAPITAAGWANLAEQLDLVMGKGEPKPGLKVVTRSSAG